MSLLYVIGSSIVVAQSSFATTLYVDDDGATGFTTIQAAVNAAVNGDEIIVAPGTYIDSGSQVVDLLGKTIWLHSADGPETTIIDGEATRQGFSCASGETSATLIEGFTVTNCYAPPSTAGAGAFLYLSSPGFINCIFANNSAYNAGGVYSYSGDSIFTDCTFTKNTASNNGGGMYFYTGNPTLVNCTITNNSAPFVGGVYSFSNQPQFDGCTISGNTADNSGGLYLSGCDAIFTNCVITNNSATATSAGGIRLADSSPSFAGTTISNNVASYLGGGIYSESFSNPVFTTCSISSNTAHSGGGYYGADYSSPTFTDCSISDNTATTGGGGIHLALSFTMTNTIVCGNILQQYVGFLVDGGGNTFSEICSWNLGACCTNDVCVQSLEADCAFFGGTWSGNETNCKTSPCPTLCMGDLDSSGVVDVSDLLMLISAWGTCP